MGKETNQVVGMVGAEVHGSGGLIKRRGNKEGVWLRGLGGVLPVKKNGSEGGEHNHIYENEEERFKRRETRVLDREPTGNSSASIRHGGEKQRGRRRPKKLVHRG